MTNNFNTYKSQKFWKLEWIIFGLMAFILNLYFFLANGSQNSYLFTFIAISVTIVIVTLKLYYNESVRKEVLNSINELPAKEPNKINIEEIFDIEEIMETTYPIFHKTLQRKKSLRNAIIHKYANELQEKMSDDYSEKTDISTLVDPLSYDTSQKLDKKWFAISQSLNYSKGDSSKRVTVIIYGLLLNDYMEYLKEEEDIFSEKRIREFLKDESTKLVD